MSVHWPDVLRDHRANGSTRKQWRREHPFGFYAKPARSPQGVLDLKKWECGIPGKDKTIWAGGLFKLEVTFPDGQISHTLAHLFPA